MNRIKAPLLLFSLLAVWGTIGSIAYKVITKSPFYHYAKSPTAFSQPGTVVEPEELQIKVEKILKTLPGTWGVYFEELDDSQNFKINPERIFYAASLNKVPILIAYFEQVEKGAIDPQSPVIYLEQDAESGDGSIQDLPFGTQLTFEETVTKMIKESDNVAKNILIREVGYNNIKSVINRVGAKQTYLPDNLTTTADMTKFFKAIYHNQLTSKKYSQLMLALLTKTNFEERLPQPLPDEVHVAHKIGSWPPTSSYHDCGIIFADSPYLLCILNENAPYSEAIEGLRKISNVVYNTVTQ